MIVDTSALVAVALREPHERALQAALLRYPGVIPAPVLVEFHRLAQGRLKRWRADAYITLDAALAAKIEVGSMLAEDALLAVEAIPRWGAGNGGPLNLVDLMVYAVHRRTGMPILCTGRDFADTDAVLHPASRRD